MFLPLLEPARYKGAHGGRGSAKSWFFADNLIDRCICHPGTRWVCVREIQQSLKDSVKQLLADRIVHFEVGHMFRVMESEIITPGDGRLVFYGMQNHTANAIKSLEGADGAWVEEAQTLSQRSLDILRPTVRREGSELWFSWNPRYATDPIDRFMRPLDEDGRPLPPPLDGIVVKATYKDNPWFPDVLRREMEYDRQRDPEKYQHVWMGEYERLSQARVFHNWTIGHVPEPPYGTVFYFGADWGFSVDPSVLVRLWFSGRTLYIDREVYKVGCEIEDTPALFDKLENGQARRWTIIADSARPETISYMQRHGYDKMRPAKKGTGSVEEGVKFLQNYDIVVDPRCEHAIEELGKYAWKTDRLTGDILPQLEDKKNHVIDALRYAVETLRTFKESVVTVGAKTARQTDWQREYFKR